MIHWLVNTVRGACMGIADIIPGVSGGTLALILGIYERFIGAVSAVGFGMLRAVFTREFWRRLIKGLKQPDAVGDDEVGRYAGHVLFLAFLVLGIGAAIIVGARVIPTLLDLYPAQMKGFFFGLVLASALIPFRQMKERGPVQLVAFLVLGVTTFFLVGQPVDQSQKARGTVVLTLSEPAAQPTRFARTDLVFMTSHHGGENEKREVAFGPVTDVVVPAGQREVQIEVVSRLAGTVANLEPNQLNAMHGAPDGAAIQQPAATAGGVDPALWFVFIAGMIAISAMVLPGVSGSFILLMLGLYHYMTFNLRQLVYDRDTAALAVVGVFLVAVIVGIMIFSRFLKWLLARYHDATMAALVGIMLGSLNKIWPFTATDPSGEVHNSLPAGFDGTTGATLGLFVVGIVIVLGLERLGRKGSQQA